MVEETKWAPNRRYLKAYLRGFDAGWEARQRKLEEPLTPEQEKRLLEEVDLELAMERLRDERERV